MNHNNSNNLEAMWNFLKKSNILLRNLLMFGNNSLRVTVLSLWLRGGQKSEKIVSLLMRYEN